METVDTIHYKCYYVVYEVGRKYPMLNPLDLTLRDPKKVRSSNRGSGGYFGARRQLAVARPVATLKLTYGDLI